MHADRTNRTMLLLVAPGLDAGAASIGACGTGSQHSHL